MYQAVKWILVFAILVACSNEEQIPENLNEKINYLIEDNRYEVALEVLENEDGADPAVLYLREKTHLNYGLHSMNTFDEGEMRTRMNEALRQFAEVLRINSENEVASQQINQILQIYETIPDRQPEDDVIESLREVGFNL